MSVALTEFRADGTQRAVSRDWVPEVPVALEFNGLAYAVMMATPQDLEDFAIGFVMAEGLAHSAADCTDIAIAEVDTGWIVRAALSEKSLSSPKELLKETGQPLRTFSIDRMKKKLIFK